MSLSLCIHTSVCLYVPTLQFVSIYPHFGFSLLYPHFSLSLYIHTSGFLYYINTSVCPYGSTLDSQICSGNLVQDNLAIQWANIIKTENRTHAVAIRPLYIQIRLYSKQSRKYHNTNNI